MRKIKRLKSKLRDWNNEVFGNLAFKKKCLIQRIKELDGLEGQNRGSSQLGEERRRAKKELEGVSLKEEQLVMQKARIQWLKEGDSNSRFFHSILNSIRSQNAISKIEKEDGSLIENEIEIVEYINRFYKSLHSKNQEVVWGIDGLDFSPIFSMCSSNLERPFEEEEVKKAVFDSDGCKTPGADGLTMAVYQRQWKVMKKDLLKVCQEFYNNGVVNVLTNETYVCLIPKKSASWRLAEFRPISLVTSLYKIITKILANRLREVLPSTVEDTQFAFVQDRLILDTVMIANEAIEEYRCKKE